jgi:hypothetical protein
LLLLHSSRANFLVRPHPAKYKGQIKSVPVPFRLVCPSPDKLCRFVFGPRARAQGISRYLRPNKREVKAFRLPPPGVGGVLLSKLFAPKRASIKPSNNTLPANVSSYFAPRSGAAGAISAGRANCVRRRCRSAKSAAPALRRGACRSQDTPAEAARFSAPGRAASPPTAPANRWSAGSRTAPETSSPGNPSTGR